MKKNELRGEILCKITKEESASFERLTHTRRGIRSLILDVTLVERDLWDALREKYKLKKEPRMVIDSDDNVVRKLF